MFPLQRGNELVIQFSNSPHHQHQQEIFEDLILDDCASLDVNDSDKIFSNSQSRKLFYGADEDHGNNSNDHKKKKMVHREIERQRRQEMATLYASLRSILPLEFIKGKRSISDHMHGAVNYINDLQMKIQDLGTKRDELRKQNNISASQLDSTSSGGVMVSPCFGGVEILVRTGFREEAGLLSRVMELLLEEGLSVVSCVSTKVNEGLLHTINCKVADPSCVDLSMLQQKLVDAVNPFS